MTTLSRSTSVTDSGVFFDTTRPHIGRIMNYLVGGRVYFAVDKMAAEQVLALVPAIRRWARLQYAFVQDVAQSLWEEGFEQFLDMASGIPTNDHLHALLPAANIVYSDVNPVAVSYGSSLVANLSNVAFVQGDARKIGTLLQHQAVLRLIDLSKKVAIGLNSAVNFLEPNDTRLLMRELYDWAPAGSRIFAVLHQVKAGKVPEHMDMLFGALQEVGLPINAPAPQDIEQRLAPWKISIHTLVPSYLGLPENVIANDDNEHIELISHAVILEK